MRLYRVTQILDQAGLIEFINSNRKVDVDIEAIDHGAPIAEPAARPKRGSRVNEAILGALQKGPAPIPSLKAALVDAGMAAGSLSTGLAALQKEGKIKRNDDGLYELAA